MPSVDCSGYYEIIFVFAFRLEEFGGETRLAFATIQLLEKHWQFICTTFVSHSQNWRQFPASNGVQLATQKISELSQIHPQKPDVRQSLLLVG